MPKQFVDLNDVQNGPVIVVPAHITHIEVESAKHSRIHFVGGGHQIVQGTLNEIVGQIWPADTQD